MAHFERKTASENLIVRKVQLNFRARFSSQIALMSATPTQRITPMKRVFLISLLFALNLAVPLTVGAQGFDPLGRACEASERLEADERSQVCQNEPGDPIVGEQGIILRAATIITNVTAIVSVIIIIIAGLTMTLSSGNSSQVQSSRDAIIYAAVALVVAALGRAIIAFVISNLT